MVVEKNGLLVCLCWRCLSKGVGQLPPPLLLNLLSCPHLPFLEPGPHKRVGVGAWPGSPELWARPHCAGYRELPSFYSCRWLLSLNPIQCHLVASTPRPAPFVTPQEGEDHLPPPKPHILWAYHHHLAYWFSDADCGRCRCGFLCVQNGAHSRGFKNHLRREMS